MKLVLSLVVVPLLGQQAVNFHSLEKERALGQHLASEIRKQSKPLTDSAVDAYVKRVGAELILHLKEAIFEYQFEVISDDEQAEPIPLPGGHILIPARTFLAAQDEAEFVGMLAHSIGHIALRHGTRTAARGQIANTASIPLVFMGGSICAHTDSQRSQVLLPVCFIEAQRTYELEADRFGLELAARAGYDASGFQRYVERKHPAESKMSPLPPRELRLAKLQETLLSLPSTNISSSVEEFERVQQAVRSVIERRQQRRAPTLKR